MKIYRVKKSFYNGLSHNVNTNLMEKEKKALKTDIEKITASKAYRLWITLFGRIF